MSGSSVRKNCRKQELGGPNCINFVVIMQLFSLWGIWFTTEKITDFCQSVCTDSSYGRIKIHILEKNQVRDFIMIKICQEKELLYLSLCGCLVKVFPWMLPVLAKRGLYCTVLGWWLLQGFLLGHTQKKTHPQLSLTPEPPFLPPENQYFLFYLPTLL